MELPPAIGLVAVALLLITNGFFVAAEFAIVAVRRSRLEQMANEGRVNARAAVHVADHLNIYIAACQVGITLASLILGWIGEPSLAHFVEPPLEALVGSFAPSLAHGTAIAISLTLITGLHIIVGEQAPKGLALQRPEATALVTTPVLRLFELIFRWPTAALNAMTNALLRLLGLEATSGHETVHSVEELRLLVTSSLQAGMVEASEARIASRAFSFADRSAGALMTPRTEVEAIPIGISQDALRARVDASPHSRLPVYRGTIDDICGVLHLVDFYRALSSGQPVQLAALLREPMIIPASKPADDLLDEMRASGRYFAVVIDEYGGTAGVITIDDLIEVLIGPMHPEPRINGPAALAIPVLESDGSRLMDGLTRLDEWEEFTGIPLSDEDKDAVETLGGLIMTRLGRIPEEGDTVEISGRLVRVEELDGKRVAWVRVLPAGTPQPAPRR